MRKLILLSLFVAQLAFAQTATLVTDSGGIHPDKVGKSVDGLLSLRTNVSVAGWIAPTNGIVGKADNSSATAGFVGEYLSSTTTGAINDVTLASNVPTNVTSLSLTAGDWDVSGQVVISFAAITPTTPSYGAQISTTSTDITPINGSQASGYNPSGVAITEVETLTLCTRRISVNTTTTVYLTAFVSTYAGGTATASGMFTARRVR